MAGVCENSNSHSDSMKGEELFDQMGDYQLSKYIGPWNHCGRLYLKCKHDAAYSGEVIMATRERTVNAAVSAEENTQKDDEQRSNRCRER